MSGRTHWIVEIAYAVLYVIPPTAIVAAVLLTRYLNGQSTRPQTIPGSAGLDGSRRGDRGRAWRRTRPLGRPKSGRSRVFAADPVGSISTNGARDEHRCVIEGAARSHAQCNDRPRRTRRATGSGYADQPAGRGARGCDWHEGSRRQRPDAPRYDLSHRVDDQAEHGRRDDDPGGGMQASAG